MNKFFRLIIQYINPKPIISEVTIREPDISKCSIANITREQYSAIMDRWDSLDMMDYPTPVFWRETDENVVFFWNEDFIDFNSVEGKRVVKELKKIGVEYEA
jgi:hypothetical protein